MNKITSNEPKLTMCGLTEREQYLLLMMKWIDVQGGWSMKDGRLTIDFKDSKITHFNLSQSYDSPKEGQVQIVQQVYRFGHPQV